MNTSAAMLIDGTAIENVLPWLYQHYPEHQPRPLLLETPYEALMDIGPILLGAPAGSALHRDWAAGLAELQQGLWLETTLPIDQLCASLQRRLRIHSPDGREFWLRLADARPLRLAWKAGATWPPGFWHGISGVWLRNEQGPLKAWGNDAPDLDCAPHENGLKAQVVLDWPLLEALTQDMDSTKETAA
ncbi:DUF4123 domain-containing protein [Atopomonas sediminilitoris]|uniref:DUF4123 domain-containing protein n=1 Tax=Atopomonas sediminilitoris TaxID=2919919 RepID=UPI001F4ECCAB|nr:DUF4123 domain-containing protein [Atopomonas sediminilitoris]MCJ8170470.1 DUF4123 domain-containing protein [Atopomonas sediminilitoris]